METLPGACRDAIPRYNAATILNSDYLRSFEWLEAKYIEILTALDVSKANSNDVSVNSGVKRPTPMWCIPHPVSMPGGFIAFDGMHTAHHNCFNNIVAFCLDSVKAAGMRIILSRSEKVVVPHDVSATYQRVVDLTDISRKRYKSLKAADKFFLMSHIIPVIFCRVLPSRLYWAVCAICFSIRILSLGALSTASIDKIEHVLCEASWVLNSYFPKNQMKVTIHLLLHAAAWVRKNGPLRYTWLYFFERFNKELTDAMTGNRVPIVTVCKTLRLGKYLKFVLDDALDATAAASAASEVEDPSLLEFEKMLSKEGRSRIKYDRYEGGKYTFTAPGVKSRLHAIVDQINTKLAKIRGKRGLKSAADNRTLEHFSDASVEVRKVYATLFNTAWSQDSDPYKIDILESDFENTSQVYHSVAYHLKANQNVLHPTKLGAYHVSCYVRVKYVLAPDASDSGNVDNEEQTGIALVMFYCVAKGSDGGDMLLAKVHFLDECPLNTPLRGSSNPSTPGYVSASAWYDAIPAATPVDLKRQCRNECESTQDCHGIHFPENNASRRVYEAIGLGDFGTKPLPFRVVTSDFAAEDLAFAVQHYGGAQCPTSNDMFVPVSSIMNKVVLVPFPIDGKQHAYAVSHCGFAEDDLLFS